ncbi:DUF1376 domain-containing protein [Pseudomonas putida]|uniref:DUF1376 domain-containing protein n=1 Tax=Pseudomonas putida TaxID=303 RepID=UPI00159F0A1E|nr:DUF1376 domain-containing protein [Pseudomonas putida]
MAALPYMQLYVADYLADTMHLTTEEHGAYLLLIFNYWQTGKGIPVTRLARIARLSDERWTVVERSLNEFFNERSGEWVHARIERDLDAVHAAQNQRVAAGKASAAARKAAAKPQKQRARNARSTPVESPLNESLTIRDTDTDTDLKETPPPAREDDFDSRVRFAMTADWQPSQKTFQAVLLQMGITQQAIDQDQFLEFRSFWCASPDDHRTQAKWEHALASHLKRNLRQAQAGGNTHGSQGPATAEANQHRARGQGPAGQNGRHQREDRSAPGRVRAAIAERQQREQVAAGVAGQAVAEDVGDVRPPLDVEFWRIG